MTQEQLERANFLAGTIRDINNLLSAHKHNVRMVLAVYPNNNRDRSENIEIEREHHQEIVTLLTKWRDEYKKELDAL